MALSLAAHTIATDQNLVNNIGVATPQMVEIGGKLYLVTLRQVPYLTSDSKIVVYGSDTSFLTWSLLAAGGNGSALEFQVVPIGTKIYIVTYNPLTNPTWNLCVWTFDTTTNALTGPSASGPATNLNGGTINLSASALNSGSVAITYTVVTNPGPTYQFATVAYDPAANTWGTAVVIDTRTGGSQAIAQIHDPASDKTVAFCNQGGSTNIVATVLDSSLAVLTTTAAIFTQTPVAGYIGRWGIPTIVSGANAPSGNLSVALPFANRNALPQILDVMWLDLTTYATTTELIDDNSDLPAGYLVQQYDQQDQPGWAAFEFNGTLYVAFTVDNGELDNASSLSFLYAKARAGGAWGGLQELYAAAQPSEMMAPFPAVWDSANLAITLNFWNPTANIQSAPVSNMTSVLLLQTAPAPTKLEISFFGTKRYVAKPPEPCFDAPPRPKRKLFEV